MALPVEPLRQMSFDIGGVNCIYGNLFLSRLASWPPTFTGNLNLIILLPFWNLCSSLSLAHVPCHLSPVDKFPDRPSNHQKEWILKDQHPSRDFQGYTCQDILTSFIRTVKWAKRNHDVNFFPDGVQMQVNSLHIFHYKGPRAVSNFVLNCLTLHKFKPFVRIIYHIVRISKFQFHTSVLLIKYLNSHLHHTPIDRPCCSVVVVVVFCLFSVFCWLFTLVLIYHRFAIPCSAHRTSETILCLRVTAPTRCDRHDRWFQIFFIFTPIWGRFPF